MNVSNSAGKSKEWVILLETELRLKCEVLPQLVDRGQLKTSALVHAYLARHALRSARYYHVISLLLRVRVHTYTHSYSLLVHSASILHPIHLAWHRKPCLGIDVPNASGHVLIHAHHIWACHVDAETRVRAPLVHLVLSAWHELIHLREAHWLLLLELLLVSTTLVHHLLLLIPVLLLLLPWQRLEGRVFLLREGLRRIGRLSSLLILLLSLLQQ